MADNVIVRVPEQQFIRGEDGYSPEVTIENIDHGHSVTITDRDHPNGQSFNVLDGDSAYEQAVAGGYTGTETQFNEELASFKTLHDETEEAAPFYAEYFVTTKEEIEAAINYKRQIFLRPNQYSSYFAQFAGSFWYIESGISGTGYRFITTIGASQTVFELKNSWSFRTYNLNAPAERAEAAAATALTRMNSADASAQAAAGSAGDASTAATTATTKAGEATASATAADGSAKDSEAYAIGKRGGTDVGSADPAYHNNAKYYAEQAASSASDAVTAKGAAETAQGKAEDAQEAAEQAQEAAEAVLESIPSDYTELSEDVDDLKSAVIDGIEYWPDTMVNGAWLGTGAFSSDYQYRVASEHKTTVFEIPTVFKVNNGYRFRPIVFNKTTGAFISAQPWQTSSYTFSTDYAWAINIALVSGEDTSSTADIPTFRKQVYIQSNAYDDFAGNKNITKPFIAPNDFIANIADSASLIGNGYLPAIFVRGTHTAQNEYIGEGYHNRITTYKPFKVENVKTYKIADGFQLRITSTYDDGTMRASGVSTGAVTLNPGLNYDITIQRVTEDTSETADIKEFIRKVYAQEEYLWLPVKFINGGRDNNGVLHTDITYRVTTEEMFTVPKRISYEIPSGYIARVTSFNMSGTKIATENNISRFVTFGTDRQYVMTLLRETEDTSETANANELWRLVNRKVSSDKHLRIVIFGHSYSADSWQYVPFILKRYGITCEIYLYYRGNDSIDRLVAEWEDTTDRGTDAWGNTHIRRFCHIDTRYTDDWDQGDGKSGYSAKMVLETAAADGKIDLITLQTAPTEVYFTKAIGGNDPRLGYEPYVRKAIDLINASYNQPYILGWFCSYTRILAYPGNTTLNYPAVTGETFDNRKDTLRAAESIYTEAPFDMVIPAAAAVFNARTNASLASSDISALGNLWYSDAVHLQAGIPSYVANATVVQSLFKQFYPEFSIHGDQTRIANDAWTTKRKCIMPSIHGSVMSTSEALYDLAQKCAVSACEHPFDITPIYNPSDNTELDFFDTKARYWADALIDNSSTLDIIANGGSTEQSGDA